ncbi:MAG: response regulator [Bacteroidales bacterium]|nr:response regulator [Bacteroidales bacterium]MBN2819682.1 response regulator [Bacteroidales bacterium]
MKKLLMPQPMIYIVDKNENYSKVVESCLKALNYKKIRVFEDGESCYSLVGSPADIIITEFNLGAKNWNGLEFLSEYKRLSPETKFIFMSSSTRVEIAVDAIKAGATDYILKSKEGLARMVKQVEHVRRVLRQKQKANRQWFFLLFMIFFVSAVSIVLSIAYRHQV